MQSWCFPETEEYASAGQDSGLGHENSQNAGRNPYELYAALWTAAYGSLWRTARGEERDKIWIWKDRTGPWYPILISFYA